METLKLEIDSIVFNMLWKSLHDREEALMRVVKQHGEDSDEGADALNDIIALRCYMEELKEQAEKVFPTNAFLVNDEPFQL